MPGPVDDDQLFSEQVWRDLFPEEVSELGQSAHDGPADNIPQLPTFQPVHRTDEPEIPVIPPVVHTFRSPHRPKYRPIDSLIITMLGYSAIMFIAFGHSVYNLLKEPVEWFVTDDEIRDEIIQETIILESVDTGLLLFVILLAGLAPPRPALKLAWAWLLGLPLLLVLLLVNVGYHYCARLVLPQDELIDIRLADGWLAILLVCIQPAVVEELFFRYLMLGHLRPHVGIHPAVWVTGLLFGMAHLSTPISWPVLILIGVGVGYARVYSGGLLLPIVLHFLHNLAVLVLDHYVEF